MVVNDEDTRHGTVYCASVTNSVFADRLDRTADLSILQQHHWNLSQVIAVFCFTLNI